MQVSLEGISAMLVGSLAGGELNVKQLARDDSRRAWPVERFSGGHDGGSPPSVASEIASDAATMA